MHGEVDRYWSAIDVFVMTSTDGGTTWSAPVQVDADAGDQRYPWLGLNPSDGSVRDRLKGRGNADGAFYRRQAKERGFRLRLRLR